MPGGGSSKKRRNLTVVVAAALGAIVLAAGAMVLIPADNPAPSQKEQEKAVEESGEKAVEEPGEKAEDGMRTLVVFEKNENSTPSEPGKLMRARRVKGEIPKTGTVATVKTDEDCAPDATGISNCLNKLRLKGGSMLEVRFSVRALEHPQARICDDCLLHCTDVMRRAIYEGTC